MEEVFFDGEPLTEDEGNDHGMDKADTITVSNGQNGITQGEKKPLPPSVGIEFESYDEAYNFYNCYAKDLGFGVRVRHSWFRQKSKDSKEKYHVVLCCSSEGFKRKRETDRLRQETRTGCPAMMRIKLMETQRWKVTEVVLDHNHLRFCKWNKNMGFRIKRKLQLDCDVGMQTHNIKNTGSHENLTYPGSGIVNHVYQYKRLKVKDGDAQAIYNYFCRMQLMNPNFFYLMDLNDEGCLGNVFWADGRSRAAYSHFGDVVSFDTTCLMNKNEVPLFAFLGVNHHGQSVLLGCGLLADETTESFLWLFRAWLTCMFGRSPSVIITDQCKAMQRAVAEVFPKACHCLCLWHIMQRVPEQLKGLHEYEAVKRALNKVVYNTLRVDEFESAWEDMIQRYEVQHHEWLQKLFEDRRQCIPVFLKGTIFAGMFTTLQSESLNAYFDGFVYKHTSLKDFFGQYELALQHNHQKEARADFESTHLNLTLKTKCCFELQLSKVYTKDIFMKFQYEVEEMYSCFNTTQVHVDGPIITYMVKERVEGEGNNREIRDYEVLYDTAKMEVRCICGCFNFKGYLCRHALSVLNYNGVEEIPSQYILSRWKKDVKRTYVPDLACNFINVNNPVQRYDHLYKRALQVVEEGVISQEHCKVALQALEESLKKVRLVEDVESNRTITLAQPNITDDIKLHDSFQAEEVVQPKQNTVQSCIERICRTTRKKIIDQKRYRDDAQGAEDFNQRLRPIAPKPPYLGQLVSIQESSSELRPNKLDATTYKKPRIGAFQSLMGQFSPTQSILHGQLDFDNPQGSPTSSSPSRARIATTSDKQLHNYPFTKLL